MSSDQSFRALLAQVRAGNEEAAATLVQQYQPAIRRAVRVRLTDPILRRAMDSLDNCRANATWSIIAPWGANGRNSPKR